MKKESPETLMRQIAYSHELLKRSNTLLSELADTVERSRILLDESYRIIAKVKVRLLFKDDPER
jgi:hypothetical protein